MRLPSPDAATGGPLAGVVVVDLSLQLPGPYATLLLAALGARVIKVEPPGGDPARGIDPDMFARVNGGKELISLDLKTAAGGEALARLVGEADVFVEGFRPGVMDRLGFGWSAVSRLNPRVVYCSLAGFGREGELARHPGHDINFLALAGGAVDGVGNGDASVRVPFVDLAAGTNAALAIVASVLDRTRTGHGRRLDMALLDAALAWSYVKRPSADGSEPAYGLFETSDCERVAVSVMEDDMWERLCAALGWWDWSADPAMARHSDRRLRADEVRERLTAALASSPSEEVLMLADRHDLGITRVNDVGDLARDGQVATRGVLDGDAGWAPLGPAGGSVRHTVDRHAGADTEAVLASFGLSVPDAS